MVEVETYKASSTCGDGPDVLLVITNTHIKPSKKDFHDLTFTQARELAGDLIAAANAAEEWYKSVDEYFEKEKANEASDSTNV